MLADAREVPNGTVINGDVCVVGAGAAGITIAHAVASPGCRVVVLESGFVEPDPKSQSLYDGESRGIPYFPLGDAGTRTRQFGGSTNRWNGECRRLDASDFETRSWVPDSGWPFALEHLQPYYERAQSACELGPPATSYEAPARPRRDRLPVDGPVETTVIQYSPPTRFGPASHDGFTRAANTTVFLGANVVDLVMTPAGRALAHVDVATMTGRRFTVRAKAFVLATGGIENARLLLAADGVHRHGIGNARDLVGRTFMEHLCVDDAATIVAAARFRSSYDTDHWIGPHRVRFALTLSEATRRTEQLPGSTFTIGGPPPAGRGIGRARAVARRAVTVFRSTGAVRVKHIQEQVPNRSSRVLLSRDRDRLGFARRADLDWRVSAVDKDAAARSHALLDAALRAAGIGRVVDSRLDAGPDWPADLRGARHHMGTTRTHEDPTRGVVDADGRVHGVANLYVAGSSVFPTSGTANPTLTIVALALRLADYLGTKVPTLGIPE